MKPRDEVGPFTIEIDPKTKRVFRRAASSRMRAYHFGAFALGTALGTAVGMLLEALRQGAMP